ncbi:MAG: glycosyltransferase family 9 protein [Coriobacteriia bacterium]
MPAPHAALSPDAAFEGVHRIVVLRANGLGDYVFALPALRALRARYPEAEITYVGLPWHVAELAGRPEPADRFVAAPPWPGVSRPETAVLSEREAAETEAFFSEMRAERFDLGVQLHGGGRNSNPFLLAMRPRVTVGTSTPGAAPLDRTLPYDYFQHEVARWLAVARLAGAEPDGVLGAEPHWAVTAEELRASGAVLRPDGRPLTILNPGAGAGRRRWSPERFAHVADALAEKGARVVVAGAAEDRRRAERIADTAHEHVESLAGQTPIRVLGGLLSRASVVVSNDSGPLHLARAVGAPTVGVYWCGNVINAGPLDALRHRTAISWRLRCPRCGTDCMESRCDHDSSFVDDVPAEEVAEKALDLLERWGRPDAVE